MIGNLHDTGAIDHDFARSVGDMRQRQQQRDFLHQRMRALERKPDPGEEHHRPAEQVEQPVGDFFAGYARGDDQPAANQIDDAENEHQQQVQVRPLLQ